MVEARREGVLRGLLVRAEALLDGVEPALDAVEAGEEHGREEVIGVSSRITCPELDTRLALLEVAGDAHGRGARALGEGRGDRRLVAGDEPAVGVGARVGPGEEGSGEGVLEDARGVGEAGLGEAVEAVAGEDRLAVLLDELVDVHARAGDLVHRLRHEGHEEAELVGAVPDDPLGEDDGVRGADEVHEVELDLELGRADLVVVVLHEDAGVLHRLDGAVAEEAVLVLGAHAVVALGKAEAGRVLVVLADALGALDRVPGVVDRGGVGDVVEDVELELDEHLHVLADAALPELLDRLLGDGAGVLGEVLAIRGHDVAEGVEGLEAFLVLDEGRGEVGHRDHVGLVDLGVAVVRGVEADAALEDLLGHVAPGQGHGMELSRDIDDDEGEVIDGRQVSRVAFQFHMRLLFRRVLRGWGLPLYA